MTTKPTLEELLKYQHSRSLAEELGSPHDEVVDAIDKLVFFLAFRDSIDGLKFPFGAARKLARRLGILALRSAEGYLRDVSHSGTRVIVRRRLKAETYKLPGLPRGHEGIPIRLGNTVLEIESREIINRSEALERAAMKIGYVRGEDALRMRWDEFVRVCKRAGYVIPDGDGVRGWGPRFPLSALKGDRSSKKGRTTIPKP
jgi:hypothetical protein